MKLIKLVAIIPLLSGSYSYATNTDKTFDENVNASEQHHSHAEILSHLPHDLSNEMLLKIPSLRKKFLEWKQEYGKIYDSLSEEAKRMLVWIKHHDFIHEHNSQTPSPSYKLGHNQFSDLSNEEYKKLNRLGEFSMGIDSILATQEKIRAKNKVSSQEPDKVVSDVRILLEENGLNQIPKNKDWRKEGAVTPVKNQGSCGGCWAFSATGAIEGAKFINDGELVSLSEQNLIDCDPSDNGCEGGLMDQAFEFDESAHGLCSESSYPYTAQDGICDNSCDKVHGSEVTNYVDIPEKSRHALLASIAVQPTSVAMQADQLVFQLYKEGVFDHPECGEEGLIDHGVLAVGYGQDEETGHNFWLVKNSWGTSWGEEGYIRLKRDMKHEYGECAIMRIMSAPSVK